MTDAAASSPPAGRVVWWPDTSALITLAIIPALRTTVVAQLIGSPNTRSVLLARAVQAELTGLTRSTGPVAAHARTALGQLQWLDKVVPLEDPHGTDLARQIQLEVAAGRPLEFQTDHWGEAAIIALAGRAQQFQSQMLSDDHSARVAADNHKVVAISVPMLLSRMVQVGTLQPAVAHAWVTTLARHNRCPAFTLQQIQTGQLGRFAEP